MRPFEAQLIVAAVQEAVRHGDVDPVLHGPVESAAASPDINPPRRTELEASRMVILILASVLLGCAILVLLVSWTLGESSAIPAQPAVRGASN
jgi:hypothetical protein